MLLRDKWNATVTSSQRWTCHKAITRSNSRRWRPYPLGTISHVHLLHHLPNLLVTKVDEILEVLAELKTVNFKNKRNLTIVKIIFLQISSLDNYDCTLKFIIYIYLIFHWSTKKKFLTFSYDSHNEIIFGKIYKILFLAF